jgi:hypothetical protein
MSTAQDIMDRAREEWLQDPNDVEWSPSRLLRHLNDSHRYLARTMARVRNARWFTTPFQFSMANGAVTFDLTTLDKKFLAVRSLYHLPQTGTPVKMDTVGEGEENWGVPIYQDLVSPETTPNYYILQTDAATRELVINPPASGTRSFNLLFVYEPDIMVADSSVLTLDQYDDLLAAEASRRAFLAEGEVDEGLSAFVTQRMNDMVEDLAGSDGESSGRRIRESGSNSGFGGY